MIMDWIYKSVHIVTSKLIFKSSEITGILGNLRISSNKDRLNERLLKMLEDYFVSGDVGQPKEYLYAHDRAIQDMVINSEISLDNFYRNFLFFYENLTKVIK